MWYNRLIELYWTLVGFRNDVDVKFLISTTSTRRIEIWGIFVGCWLGGFVHGFSLQHVSLSK